jgi:hypothetical protein
VVLLGLPIDRSLYMTSKETIIINKITAKDGSKKRGLRNLFMGDYSTTIKRFFQLLLGLAIILVLTALLIPNKQKANEKNPVSKESYWLLLHRKSNVEFLYKGIPGVKEKSKIIKKFQVKSGAPGQKPTPLPELLGREYWLITGKVETLDNPETAPYFLILDIPYSEEYPYGPTPYLECNGQCDWVLPGSFGLHGINSDPSRLGAGNPGSSGCVRHKDEDITYLYNLLDPEKEEIRYYIEDI